ncbi:MAG: tRNA lysidine(34) synthetase TilS [Deltaproteobacteria bacterium]|nr:tRNA lysidine(34) synthetase TilS [Deltaproteobacteria bacterium]
MLKVRKAIEKYSMLNPGDRVGIAVSGGADSVALLYELSILADEYDLALFILHLNHGIRGEESDRDEAFVVELAGSMGIPADSERVSIPELIEKKGGSLEDICREERYAFFERMSQKHGLNKIALGHNLNDQTETVIMRFLRGSGLEGLKGFLPVRDGIYIRPLIDSTREEIISFLEERDIRFVTDSSNADDIHLRNRIRNILVPELKASYNVRLEENISRTADILRLEDDFIRGSVEEIIADWKIDRGNARINIRKLKKLHPALQWRLIKTVLENRSPARNGIGYLHVKSVVDLVEGLRPNASVDLPFNLRAEREYDELIISQGEDRSPDTPKKYSPDGREDCNFSYTVEIPGSVNIVETGGKMVLDVIDADEANIQSDNSVFMDYNSISFPLVVRNIRAGDRIQPLGMKGTKKISELLIDKKIPKAGRKSISLLVDRKSVLWVPGVKLSDRVRITDVTEKVVKAKII